MKALNKLLYSLFLFVFCVLNAQGTGPGGQPPEPGGPPTGPGGDSVPIDMYIYLLSIVAVAFIVFYTKKYKSQKI
ncbi:signal peptidase [Chryseobacterium paridis]|uniref:Signal peptidase n=1 Tax=Chryseobacterium paridis TaxID=2800328 RepID=A0ABS1FP01_9FLAO|nr:signal peptidase [Chryseobacterium paridis]MBK1894147.1 signal peptidase [Chryseobacterium paridis]